MAYIDQIIADMTEAFEAPGVAPQIVTGMGNGSSGVIQMVHFQTGQGAVPSWDANNPNLNLSSTFQWCYPWAVVIAGNGHVNNGTALVECWAMGLQVASGASSEAFFEPTGYPTDAFDPAYYFDSTAQPSQLSIGTFTLANGHRAFELPSGVPNGYWMMHNGYGPGYSFPSATDVLSTHSRFKFRLVPIPRTPSTFDPAYYKAMAQAGTDVYPVPNTFGYIVPGNMSTARLVAIWERSVSVTLFRDDGGRIQISTPVDPSLLATYPKSETWLRAHPPLDNGFYSEAAPSPTPSPSPTPTPTPTPLETTALATWFAPRASWHATAAVTKPVMSLTSLHTGTVGTVYTSVTPTANGVGVTFEVQGLPAGLAYSGGTINGTPAVDGTFSVRIRPTSLDGGVGDWKSYQLRIYPEGVFEDPGAWIPQLRRRRG